MDQADRAHPLCPLVYPISSLSESATIVLGVLLVFSAVNGMVNFMGTLLDILSQTLSLNMTALKKGR